MSDENFDIDLSDMRVEVSLKLQPELVEALSERYPNEKFSRICRAALIVLDDATEKKS